MRKNLAILLVALLLSPWLLAKDKRFTDASGHVLSIELMKGQGLAVQGWEDGRSAMTGPYLKPAEVVTLSSHLRTAWARRAKSWGSPFVRGYDGWVVVKANETGKVLIFCGDPRHTAKSFSIADKSTLDAIQRALVAGKSTAGSSGGAQPSLGESPAYPTHP